MYAPLGLAISAFALLLASLSPRADEPSTLRDPTRPPLGTPVGPASTERQVTHLDLQSTLVTPDRRRAVVNGRSVGIGDRVLGATITDIQPAAVVLERNGQQITLHLLPRGLVDRRDGSTQGGRS